jgi:hypothetical protein
MGRDHELAGELGGDLGAVIPADHVQAQVDAGGAPGGGQDVALVDEQHPRVDRHVRVPAGELLALRPVRGGPAAVEQPRVGQGECTGAQRDDATPPGVGLAQDVRQASAR